MKSSLFHSLVTFFNLRNSCFHEISQKKRIGESKFQVWENTCIMAWVLLLTHRRYHILWRKITTISLTSYFDFHNFASFIFLDNYNLLNHEFHPQSAKKQGLKNPLLAFHSVQITEFFSQCRNCIKLVPQFHFQVTAEKFSVALFWELQTWAA